MIAKVLQVLGGVVLIVAIGTTIAGFVLLKDRIRIVVQADSETGKPDATALLRDDVHQLVEAQQALSNAVEENFARLQQASEATAAQRQQELLAALRRFEGLQEATNGVAKRLAAVESALREVAARTASAETAALAAASKLVTAPPVEPVVAPPAQIAPPAADSKPEVPKPAPTTGFLSFQLPASQFHFDRTQDYELLPELSRVGFDAKSTLHDFSGVTSSLAGHFTANLGDAAGGWKGEVTCKVATLATGVDGRDEGLRERMDSAHHSEIRFELTSFTPAKDGIDVAQKTVRGDAIGKMTIRGVTRELVMPIKVSVDQSRRVQVEGEAQLKMGDYGVVAPSQLGVISVQDEVRVWLSLRARAKVQK